MYKGRFSMIYHVSYPSGEWTVKGYLGLPPSLPFSAGEVREQLECRFRASSLPVTVLAEDVPRRDPPAAQQRYPALLYCRGGMGSFGRVKTHWIEYFARSGFVVFAPSYRGNEGGEGRDQFGGDENEDVIAAFRCLQRLPYVQPDRISIMGFSRGAVNAAQTAVRIPETYKLVLWSGVSDLAATYEERVDLRKTLKRVVGGTPAKVPEAYAARSPIRLAALFPCPTLVMHGSKDEQVNVHHGLDLFSALRQLEKPAELHLYEGCGHLLPSPLHEAAVDRMLHWLTFG